MQIQINTDHNIQGREALAARLSGVVQHSLGRVAEHITRVEVHLSIESGGKSGQSDKRCTMEARLERLQPVVVTEHAGTLDQAVDGAASKLLRAIDGTLGRRRDKSHRGADEELPSETETPDD
jgi:ribosome-associated translation inhibitor RaiA